MVPEISSMTDIFFCHFGPFFCSFTSLTTQKIKILIKWRKCLEILSFCKCVPYMAVIWCIVSWDMECNGQIFCHSGPVFALLLPYRPRESKFWKNEKHTWRYYHFTHVYHKWQSYDIWLLRYEAWQHNFLSFWTVFCPFALLTIRKIKILKNWKKKHMEISSFYTSVPKIMIISYNVP